MERFPSEDLFAAVASLSLTLATSVFVVHTLTCVRPQVACEVPAAKGLVMLRTPPKQAPTPANNV